MDAARLEIFSHVGALLVHLHSIPYHREEFAAKMQQYKKSDVEFVLRFMGEHGRILWLHCRLYDDEKSNANGW